jgi:hypothetical protein
MKKMALVAVLFLSCNMAMGESVAIEALKKGHNFIFFLLHVCFVRCKLKKIIPLEAFIGHSSGLGVNMPAPTMIGKM